MSPKKITVLLRRPDRIGRGLEAARTLGDAADSARVVFFCPGCASGLACNAADSKAERPRVPCFTDRCGDCIPRGFHCADAERIARLIRDSDIVVPL